MKSDETKDTSLDISKNKAIPIKPILFTIESSNKELLKKKRFKVRTKKMKEIKKLQINVFFMDIGQNQIIINLLRLYIFMIMIGQTYKIT